MPDGQRWKGYGLMIERAERWREGEELRKWEKGRNWKGVGSEKREESLKYFTDFSSVKIFIVFAFGFSFDRKYFTFGQLFYCKTSIVKCENIFLKIFFLREKIEKIFCIKTNRSL